MKEIIKIRIGLFQRVPVGQVKKIWYKIIQMKILKRISLFRVKSSLIVDITIMLMHRAQSENSTSKVDPE